ncbi:hypothetical protein LDENG_00218420 [Lucifuga dentata]|nr:hypothetical protein LDENG_00218420 [Lucifuga dentata]
MAEEGSVYELEGFEKQFGSLLSRFSGENLRAESKAFCLDFSKLVEEYVSLWQTPQPRLRVLEIALCYFTQASSFFSSNCDHVLHTLSSLALSVFELLLFFDQKDFHQDPLKHFAITFQECHLVLAKHQNVHLTQVGQVVQGGGPWASSALQAILTESSLPQNGVDGYISSELPVFLEFRVRYLLACERISEAMALAKCCARHPTAGQHLFFLQVYLTWLHKTSQHDHLQKEVADLSGKDGVHIICSLETEEKDELLLALSRAFLSQQLRRGDMYYLWELVFIWSKLHSRLRTSKQALLKESHQLMLSATNVNSIFPFIRVILQELGEEGIQFCVELCANALQSCLPCDVVTKSLIYKTIASLLPNDLEVCRACALLVFFLERTIEAYKIVYILYMHPDQQYHADYSPVGNHIRFEALQVLKKGLYFDPEFWNLIALRTNCLKLMSEKVDSAALEEIMEENWVPNYCTKHPNFYSGTTECQGGIKGADQAGAKKRQHKENRSDMASKRIKVSPGRTRVTAEHTVKKKGNQGLRSMKEASSEPIRRSFWQLDKIQDDLAWQFGSGEHRRTTRLSEKNPPKRRIRKPKWLLEDSGTLEKNKTRSKVKKHGMKSQHQKQHQSSMKKSSISDQDRNNMKHKTSLNSHLKARENEDKHQKGSSVDYLKPTSPPHIILELSLPDNELLGTFTEDTCNRQRGYPQMLLYKPMVKLPAKSPPVKAGHRNEVILRAQDVSTFVQQLHCYTRRQKGKGVRSNIRVSVSTITRSSVQGSPPKESPTELCQNTPTATDVKESTVLDEVPQTQTTNEISDKTASATELCEKPDFDMKVAIASPTPAAAEVTESPILDKVPQAQTTERVSPNRAAARDVCEKPDVKIKVTAASQTPAVAQMTQSPALNLVSHGQVTEDISQVTAPEKVSQTSTAAPDEIPPVTTMAKISNTEAAHHTPSHTQNVELRCGETLLNGTGEQELNSIISQSETETEIVSLKANNALMCTSIMVKEERPETVLNSVKDSNSTTAARLLPEDSKGHAASNEKVKAELPDTNAAAKADTKDTKGPGDKMATVSETKPAEASYAPEKPASKDDLCHLTLVTEMVTELAPEAFAGNLDCKKSVKEDIASKDFPAVLENKPDVPHKILTTSSSSLTEQAVSAVVDIEVKQEKDRTQDAAEEMLENSDAMEAPQESEKSKLEFCCIFCNKVFRGNRVAAHAMFHYRKDECMFCSMMFKDDLLAMMHLSDHIEKLKKSIESPGSKAQENQVSGTKDNCTPQTSKAKTTKSANLKCLKPQSSLSESRTLRSNNKPADNHFLQKKKQNTSKHHTTKTIHKVNGHIGKCKDDLKGMKEDTLNLKAKQPLTEPEISHQEKANTGKNVRLLENEDLQVDSSTTPVQMKKEFGSSSEDKLKETESPQVSRTAAKLNKRVAEENNTEKQERCSCPVDGCIWYTDLSKNHVALLYHALDDHYGDVKPLELAFRVGNNKCSVCKRVLLSFEHFQHHVEIHRLTPRHPCLHQGCTARFKTGIEMRRHTRRHNPLQAVCCLPGCSQLFICLWALNLHERAHYASKPSKAVKKTNVPVAEKQNNTSVEKKQQSRKLKEATAAAVNRTLCAKTARKLRGQTADNSSTAKHVKTVPLTTVKRSWVIEWKKRNDSKDSNVLKNLSNRNTSTQPACPTLRLRQNLRKGKERKTNAAVHKIHKVPMSSLLKPSGKVKAKLKKVQIKVKTKGPKRSAKSEKSVNDENTTSHQSDEAVRELTDVQEEQNSGNLCWPPTSPPETAETSTTRNELKVEEEKIQQVQDQDVVKTTTTLALAEESQSKKSTDTQITSNINSTPTITAKSLNKMTNAAEKKQQKTADKLKKLNTMKKPENLKDKSAQSAASDSSKTKKHKIGAKKAVKERYPPKELGPSSALKKPAKSKSVVGCVETKASVDEMGKAKEKTPESTIDSTGNEDEKTHGGHSGIWKSTYMRLPPTAYLDEQYTTMPKRRKEMSMFSQASQRNLPVNQPSSTFPLQRQRCPSCFICFCSAEELQTHVQLQTCSSLFGFDSDDEGDTLK